eukprot:58010_1
MKKQQDLMCFLNHHKEKKKNKSKPKIIHTASTIDDKARGLRQAQIAAAGVGLIDNGGKDDKINRLAFRFGLAALPHTSFKTMDDVNPQAVWPVIQFLAAATSKLAYEKIKFGVIVRGKKK